MVREASRRTWHAASYWSRSFMPSLLPRTIFSVNSRGLICPNPLKRQQDRHLTSRFWPLSINAFSLENHKFGRGEVALEETCHFLAIEFPITGSWGTDEEMPLRDDIAF